MCAVIQSSGAKGAARRGSRVLTPCGRWSLVECGAVPELAYTWLGTRTSRCLFNFSYLNVVETPRGLRRKESRNRKPISLIEERTLPWPPLSRRIESLWRVGYRRGDSSLPVVTRRRVSRPAHTLPARKLARKPPV